MQLTRPIVTKLNIVFEGINGCGKSTLIAALSEHLNNYGITTCIVSGVKSATANSIRHTNIFREEFLADYLLETALVACERRCDLSSRKERQGQVGLFERGVPSLFAFGAVRGLKAETLQILVEVIIPDFPTDRWVLVDVDVEIAAERLRSEERHRFEEYSLSWYDELRQNYLRLADADKQHALVVDGAREVGQIVDQIAHEFF